MDEFSVAVVGIGFPNADKSNRRFELLICEPGEPVRLCPQPKNPADEYAIAVMSARGIQIGYVAARRCIWLLKLMRSDEHVAVFQGLERQTAWIRIRFGGGTPTLPAQRARPEPDDAWDCVDPDPDLVMGY